MSLSKVFKYIGVGVGLIGYGSGIYLIYDSYKILMQQKQDLKVFDPMSNKLICDASYQYTRNPMYLGGLLTFGSGWILTLHFNVFPFNSMLNIFIHCSIGSLLFVSIYYLNHYIIPYEELKCHEKYGQEYIQYKQNVSRWIPYI